MSTWRIERHYGFGAAQIPIQPEPHRAAQIGLVEGVGALIDELTEGGVVATVCRAAGEASAILLSLLILTAVVVTLTRDYSDVSSIEVVLLETVVPQPQPIVVESVRVEIAKTEPPKSVAPMSPPQQQIIAKPKPPPVQLPDRAVRKHPQPTTRARIAIDAARPKPLRRPTKSRIDRIARAPVDPANPARPIPRPDTPAAPALDLPSEAPSKPAFRVASAKPAPGKRPRAFPGIAPTRHYTEVASTPPAPRPARTSRLRATASRPAHGQAPKLSSAPVPLATGAPAATPKRAARLAPTTASRRAPRPTAQFARAAESLEPTPPTPASRSGRAAPAMLRGPTGDRTAVAGVPLGELAACLSDREEDRLKQAVLAAVTTQSECVSSTGTYRFVETKNLNAFLMWIDRAPARPLSDRCVELGYALECLQGVSRRTAR